MLKLIHASYLTEFLGQWRTESANVIWSKDLQTNPNIVLYTKEGGMMMMGKHST